MMSIEKSSLPPDITVISLIGRVTAGHVHELARVVDDLNNAGVRRVIVDFAEADSLDSTGMGLIFMYAQTLKNVGGQLRIAAAHGAVAHTLALCKVSDVIPVLATTTEAASSFSKAAGA